MIITFSGAHSTGKTTLLNDLCDSLSQRSSVSVVPSVSSHYFDLHFQQTGKRLSYDDINRLYLRHHMQFHLPIYLQNHVAKAHDGQHEYVLVDRWFADISTYSRIEGIVVEEIYRWCRACCDSLKKYVGDRPILHVRTTTAASRDFPIDHKINRGTTNPQEWENTLSELWGDYELGKTHIICSSGRADRIGEIKGRISEIQGPPTG